MDALYNTTTSNTRKYLFVDTVGKLCVSAKKDFPGSEEIESLKEENEKLKRRLGEIEELLRKLNK